MAAAHVSLQASRIAKVRRMTPSAFNRDPVRYAGGRRKLTQVDSGQQEPSGYENSARKMHARPVEASALSVSRYVTEQQAG